MKKTTSNLTPTIYGAATLSLLTVLVYFFSNNTAQIVLFQALGVAVPLAVVFFAFSFFLADFIQKKLGTKFAILNTIAATVLVAMLYVQSALVSGTYDFSFFYVLMVSTVTAIIAGTIDALVFKRIFKRDTTKTAKAALVSNAVSIPIDTLLFCYFVFYLIFGMPIELVISLGFGQIIVKYIIAAMMTPVIAKVNAGAVWK